MLRGRLSRRARERLTEATSRRVGEGGGDSVIDSYYCISLHLGCLKQGERGGSVSLKCRMGETTLLHSPRLQVDLFKRISFRVIFVFEFS